MIRWLGRKVCLRAATGLERLVGPGLGKLRQHRARPLRLPAHYPQAQIPKHLPRISIVTPSFNQGAYLEYTLRSVLDQHYPDLEYIVQDGGSKDESAAILGKYASRLHHCELAPDSGQAQALNRGFAHATGALLAYLNADDLLLPGALASVARFFVRHPQVDVVYGHRILIDAANREIGRWILPPHEDAALLWRDYVPQETLFWRRRLWERVGAAFDESLQFALDWDLLLRFQRAGAVFARLPRFLGAFRVHERQKTSAQLGRGLAEMEQLRYRHHGRAVDAVEIERRVRPYLRRQLVCRVLSRLGLLAY